MSGRDHRQPNAAAWLMSMAAPDNTSRRAILELGTVRRPSSDDAIAFAQHVEDNRPEKGNRGREPGIDERIAARPVEPEPGQQRRDRLGRVEPFVGDPAVDGEEAKGKAIHPDRDRGDMNHVGTAGDAPDRSGYGLAAEQRAVEE
jgi:hypothetical protein